MENPADYDVDKDMGDEDPDENTIGICNIEIQYVIFISVTMQNI